MGKQQNVWIQVILCTLIGHHSEGINTSGSIINNMSVISRDSSTTSWTPDSTRGTINLTPSNNQSLTMYLQNTTEGGHVARDMNETSQVQVMVTHSTKRDTTQKVDIVEPSNVTTQDITITMTTPSFKHHHLSFVFIIQMGVLLISSSCILLAVFVTFIIYKKRKPNINNLGMDTTDNVLKEHAKKQLITQSLNYETNEYTYPIGQHTTNGTLHEYDCAQNMLPTTSGEDIEDHYHHLNFSLMNEEGNNIVHVSETEYDLPMQQVQTEVDDIYEKPWDSHKLNNMVAEILPTMVKGKHNLRKSLGFTRRRSNVLNSDGNEVEQCCGVKINLETVLYDTPSSESIVHNDDARSNMPNE